MKKYISLMLLASLLSFQLVFLETSHAAPGSADLEVNVGASYIGAVGYIDVFNHGDETVESFEITLDDVQNFDIESIEINMMTSSGGSTTTDMGSIVVAPDFSTISWTGVIEDGQKLSLWIFGEQTGAVGDTLSLSASIDDGVLLGGAANVDPIQVNNSHNASMTIVEHPDVAIETRLLTQGDIQVGDNIEYEVLYKNIGSGAVPQGESVVSVFSIIVPDGTSPAGFEDLDTGDALDGGIAGCMLAGAAGNMGPGAAHINGQLVICLLNRNADLVPGSSFPFKLILEVTSDFVSGVSGVHVIATGPDLDSLSLQQMLITGINIFDDGEIPVNNAVHLVYHADDLIPTINRCPGVGAVTSKSNGCFRVSFSKKIWDDSFTPSSLVLSAGNIVSLTKIGHNLWEVLVDGLPLNQDVTLTIAEGAVHDYSAIENSVQVLGENVIRYQVSPPGSGNNPPAGNNDKGNNSGGNGNVAGTATGTLPNTGSDANWSLGFMLILLGIMLETLSRRKRNLI